MNGKIKKASKQIAQIKNILNSKNSKNLIIVSIDGRGGAGKSTIAAAIRHNYESVSIVHTDDFYRPMSNTDRMSLDAKGGYQKYFDWERLKSQVLSPLSQGKLSRYQCYNWIEEKLKEWVEIFPNGKIIVEGVYSSRPELRKYYDLIIYIDTPFEVCYSRLLKRGENSLDWIDRWAAAEKYYVSNFQPIDYADFVLSGC